MFQIVKRLGAHNLFKMTANTVAFIILSISSDAVPPKKRAAGFPFRRTIHFFSLFFIPYSRCPSLLYRYFPFSPSYEIRNAHTQCSRVLRLELG